MSDSIYTIPVKEVFEEKCGCPICKIRDTLEERNVSYIMGAAMMEPNVRIETNRMGFCRKHYSMMLNQKNRLSLALILESHLNHIKSKSLKEKPSPLKKFGQKNSNSTESCFVCQRVDKAMEAIINNMFDLYEKDKDFRILFSEQEALCLPHFRLLTSLSDSRLSKKARKEFDVMAQKLAEGYLENLCGDVSHFAKMFDYRNMGNNADWGNSKDSIERAIWFLTSEK